MNSHPAFRIARALALTIGTLAFCGTIFLIYLETVWNRKNQPQPDGKHAFVEGTIGTEVAPLVVMEILPEMFPEEFHPTDTYLKSQGVDKPSAGDWIDQYGFVRKSLAPEPNDRSALPVGFVVSYHRPGSGASSPIPFVALSCAACHSAEIRTDITKPGRVFYGVGNPTMNLLAFSEAIRAILLKKKIPADPADPYELSIASIEKKLNEKGRSLTFTESVITNAWLSGARSETDDYQRVIDAPYTAKQLFDYRFMMAGPARTQPFRSLIRVHLDRPGWWNEGHQMDQGFSKIPVVFHQDHKYHGDWAQFDGCVNDITARSTLAASTAGGNVQNLARRDIASNVIKAAEFTADLPSYEWKDAFGDQFKIDPDLARKGKEVYKALYCLRCHGEPLIDADGKRLWTWEKLDAAEKEKGWSWPGSETKLKFSFGDIVPVDEIKTDSNRVRFRHKDEVPERVADEFGKNFRKNHPLATFTKDNLRAPDGYYNGPISGAFLRAPYLHNASILTLKELIGLEERRKFFYRGRNLYDPEGVGFQSPKVAVHNVTGEPVSTKPHDQNYYFFFDTRMRGNSNQGHEYPPWAFDKSKPMTPEQKQQLTQLLEYLKSL